MTAAEKKEYKESLKKQCILIIQARVKTANEAMIRAQEAANSEDKSSMGDKYETSRALGHIERDMNAKQVKEALAELKSLEILNVENLYSNIVPGSWIDLGTDKIFIACGLGIIKFRDEEITIISGQSPLFNQIKGKQCGDEIIFKSEPKIIKEIF